MLDLAGEVAQALGVLPGEVWLVRPDAYVLAVVAADDRTALQTAGQRLLGVADEPDEPDEPDVADVTGGLR